MCLVAERWPVCVALEREVSRLRPGSQRLSADHAWRALRRYGGWPLLRDSFVRFRSGDGFSHARALGCSYTWPRLR
jgi:hypothetical protein